MVKHQKVWKCYENGCSKRRQKKQSIKHNKQPEANITNEKYEEPLEQKKAHIVPGRRTYSEATKFGKKICVIGHSHLNRIKRNLFQKFFWVATSKRLNHYILPTLHEHHPNVVLLHSGPNDINN